MSGPLLLESLRPPAGYHPASGGGYQLHAGPDRPADGAPSVHFLRRARRGWRSGGRPGGAPRGSSTTRQERHASSVRAGAIAVPRPEQTLLAYLEGSVVEGTTAPRRRDLPPQAVGAGLRSGGGAGDLSCALFVPQPDFRPVLGYMSFARGAFETAATRLLAKQAARRTTRGPSGTRHPSDTSRRTQGPGADGVRDPKGGLAAARAIC